MIAAGRLMSSLDDVGVRYVEGPERYSSADVAQAFADALDQQVAVEVTPRDEWVATYLKLGFSQPAAESYSRMTALVLDNGFQFDNLIRCDTSLSQYVRRMVANKLR